MRGSVLIVEDERIVAMDLQATLRDLGHDAFAIASSADEAIAAVNQRCPDVVLMDIRIKGAVDGIETAARLRARFDLAIIFLTAHNDDATLARASDTAPDGYVQKPVQVDALRLAVEHALSSSPALRRRRQPNG